MLVSADDLLVAVQNGEKPPEVPFEKTQATDVMGDDFGKRGNPYEGQDLPVSEETVEETAKPTKAIEAQAVPEVTRETEQETVQETHDEYGNEVKPQPAKVYTEEEVRERINAAVRDRLQRGNHPPPAAEPVTQQQVAQAAEGFEYNKANPEPWEVQLKSFIKQTLDEERQLQTRQAAQYEEQRITDAFEAKLMTGAQRFPDFSNVMQGKPISDAMVVATRSFEDPAGFLYAAATKQPQELERISKIKDPYAQVVEMGRLEERMKRVKTATSAAKPIVKRTGDVIGKDRSKQNIDDMIAQYAQTRRIR